MEFHFVNNEEVIRCASLSRNEWWKESRAPLGTFIFDFLYLDLDDSEEAVEFFHRWGEGLLESDEIRKNITESKQLSVKENKHILQKAINKERNELIRLREALKFALYECLDLDGPKWTEGLSPIKRYFVAINRMGQPLFTEKPVKVTTIIEPLAKENLFTNRGYLEQEDIALAIKDLEITWSVTLHVENIEDLIKCMLKKLIDDGLSVRICAHCGKYFIPTGRKDAKYCLRYVDADHTCRDVGPIKEFAKRAKEDEVLTAYNKAYKTMHARLKARGPRKIDEGQLAQWVIEAKNRIELIKNKLMTLEEFETWRKHYDNY